MERHNDHGYKQEIEHDQESWLERTNLHLGKDAREGQQGEDIFEAYGLSLHGEKQSLQGENQELKGKIEKGIKEAKGA